MSLYDHHLCKTGPVFRVNGKSTQLSLDLFLSERLGRDAEYVRCGTVSLPAGTDLISGKVPAMVRTHHRSQEFVEYLKMIDRNYPANVTIIMLLDNLSAHKSKDTQEFLSSLPNRFLFVFTPVHASWLNVIESLFSKLARSVLRGMRVASLENLVQRLTQYIEYLNQNPLVFRRRYGLERLELI